MVFDKPASHFPKRIEIEFHSDASYLTHEVLARMLGVRRVGITCAASDLQRRGLIRYHRGEITVLARAGLEASACGCNAADRQTYDRVLG